MSDLRDYITPEDAANMIAHAETEEDKMMMIVLWASGRRISEVVGPLGISVADIDAEHNLIMFSILKKRVSENGQIPQAMKPIDHETIAMLLDYCRRHSIQGKIFPRNRRWAQRAFVRAAIKSNVRAANGSMPHPHHFRHSFAVRAVRAAKTPGDLLALQSMLEHKKFETTQIYTQFNPQDSRSLIDRMKEKDDQHN
jgi:site-specific recombinase XerD